MVINLAIKFISLFLLIPVLLLTGCSDQKNRPVDIQTFNKMIKKNESWSVTAIWLFKSPDAKSTTLTGRSWFDRNGDNFIYQDTYSSVSTYLMVFDGLLSAPVDSHPLRKIRIKEKVATLRVNQDLFTYNPLNLATVDKIKMYYNSDGLYSGEGKCKIINSNNPCVKSNLKVKFSSNGKIKIITYHREYKLGESEEIIFNYSNYNHISIKNIAKNLKIKESAPISYPK
jgi:hypothetical protein